MMTLPALTAEIDAALRQSIEDFGVVVPVVYNRGELIDGNNRTRIATELGIEVPRIDLNIEPEQAGLLAVELNTARRQLTYDMRRKIVKSLIESGYSQRATAKAIGITQKQVWVDVKKSSDVATSGVSSGNKPDTPIKVKRGDQEYDQKRPATRKKAAPPAQGTGRGDILSKAMQDKLQRTLGSFSGAMEYFEEADLTILGYTLGHAEINTLARDARSISKRLSKLATHLQEVGHDAQ